MKDKVAHVCIHNNSSHESDFKLKSNTRDCFTTFPNRKKKVGNMIHYVFGNVVKQICYCFLWTMPAELDKGNDSLFPGWLFIMADK